MNRATILALVLAAACSGQQGTRADIPAEGRPLWDQCRSSVDSYCHERAVGDPTRERECEGQTGVDYAALRDEAARRRFLMEHGCRL